MMDDEFSVSNKIENYKLAVSDPGIREKFRDLWLEIYELIPLFFAINKKR